jgi:hypothetical protein
MNRASALAILERYRTALGLPLQPAERARIQGLYDEALAVIAGRDGRRARILKLEERLAHLPPRQRAAAITAELGISRATYFREKSSVSTRETGAT